MLKLYVAAKTRWTDFLEDKKGATIIEYSLLIGLLTVAVVIAVAAVGPWLALQWQALCTAIGIVCV